MNKMNGRELVYRLITSACICISYRILIKDTFNYLLACLGTAIIAGVISGYLELRKDKK